MKSFCTPIVLFWFVAITTVFFARSAPPFASADDPIGVHVMVVCPQQFRDSFEPWVKHREAEHCKVTLLDSQKNAKALKSTLQENATNQTRYVLLVGDAPVIGKTCDTSREVPTNYLKTTVTGKWGSTPTLASDMPFGDFDRDGIPNTSVGRLPVRRAVELEHVIDRIIAYEKSRDFGAWRSRVQLVGGVGGFGAMADATIESVTRTVVTSVLPADTKTNVAYASPGHLFYPKGDSFTDAVVDQYAKGSRFWVYAGHGNVTALDRVPQTRDGIPVLDLKSVSRLDRPADSAPIAMMLACYTGAIDASEDSIGERMMLLDGGPIAVFAGSRITMPYGNTTAAVGLIKSVYEERLPRLGDAWLSTLKQMQADDPTSKSTSRIMIDAIATFVSPKGTKLVDERHEHMALYNLFGDPMLKLQHPHKANVDVATGFDAGVPIVVEVNSPITGELTVSLDHPLGAVTKGDPNATTVASMTLPAMAKTKTTATFKVKEDVSGPFVVRAIISGKDAWASGASKTRIRPKQD